MRGLESDGVVTGYAAVVDEALLGFGVDALVEVDLAPGTDEVSVSCSTSRSAAEHGCRDRLHPHSVAAAR